MSKIVIVMEIGIDDVKVGDMNELESHVKSFQWKIKHMQFSVCTFHEIKCFSSILYLLLKILEQNLMY
jgi:hypothetical protein